jgi:ATP synthase delta (OSCP) subunit
MLPTQLCPNSQVKDHFANPVVPEDDKREMLEKLSKDADFSQHTQNFLGLLVQVLPLPSQPDSGIHQCNVGRADAGTPGAACSVASACWFGPCQWKSYVQHRRLHAFKACHLRACVDRADAVLLLQARRFEVIDEIVSAFENEYCKITDTQVWMLDVAMQVHQPCA